MGLHWYGTELKTGAGKTFRGEGEWGLTPQVSSPPATQNMPSTSNTKNYQPLKKNTDALYPKHHLHN